jgi:hypothetical protein
MRERLAFAHRDPRIQRALGVCPPAKAAGIVTKDAILAGQPLLRAQDLERRLRQRRDMPRSVFGARRRQGDLLGLKINFRPIQ